MNWDVWIASAVLAALALLTRYTGLLFLPVAAATIAIAALARLPGATVRTLRSPVPWLGLLAAAAVLAPWFVREARLAGDPFAGIRLAAGLVPRWASMPWHFYLSTLPATVTWPVVVLMLLGVVVVARERPTAGTVCLLAAACVIAWHSRYPYKEERFIGAALPFLATVGALGLTRVVHPARGRGHSASRASSARWSSCAR